ncbi:hypothetical protein SESBI_05790 [Sesbania bispinosa]|nr:hypothetical protein SESBI_05790 [Sesbania bispinosa]
MASRGLNRLYQQPGATAGGIEVTMAEFMKLKPPTFSGSNANEDPHRFIDESRETMESVRLFGYQGRGVGILSVRGGVAYDCFDTVTCGRSVGSPPLVWGEFSRHDPYPIIEEMRVKSVKRRKGTVAEILARNSGLRDRRVVIPVLVWDQFPVIKCSKERYHRGVVLVSSLWEQRKIVDQIRGDLHGPLFHGGILE